MPDFDKDLRPTLLNKDETLPQLGNPLVPTPSSPYTQSVQARNSGPNTAIDAFFGAGPKITEMAPTVSVAELQANKRYGIYNPETIDIEDQKANAQSSAVKATSGILKGLNLAATTVAGGFGMLGGTVQSMFTGRLADIWDNEAMRKLDEWNNKVDQEYLPNYYTNQEKQASWYSTDNWFTTNFLFDKLIKNSGFAVGAMVSGNIANSAVKAIGAGIGAFADAKATTQIANQAMKWYTPLLKNTARAFSSGKNIEVANALQKGISTVTELDAVTSEIGNIAKQFNAFNKINDVGRRTVVALYSQAGEASFEAMQTSKEYKENLINEWKSTHGGEEPNGEDLAIINRNADRVGKMSFFGNMALLSVTEYAQLPKILGSSYAAEKEAANSFLGGVNEVVLKDGKYIAKQATTKFGKIYDKVAGVTRYVSDWKEGLQENLQYALQVGTQRYYNKAYQGKDAETLVDSMIYGLVGVDDKGEGVGSLVSNEGMEGTLLGAITGGLMQARGTYQENKLLKSNTTKFLDQINNAPTFKEAFIDRMRSINRAVVLQQQQQDAIIQGDKLEAKDLEADQMHNYLSTRIKYGRYDMIKEDIKDLQLESATTEGLNKLKEQGIGNINDDIQSFQARLNNFERVADYTNELYKSSELRFGGIVNESGNRKYSPEIIDKMVYAAAKIADYDLRIPKVNVELSKYGIATQEILNTWLKEGKSNKAVTKEALKQINALEEEIDNLDQPKVIKDGLKTALSDVMEMSARRKLFISEYDDIVENPDSYTGPTTEEIEAQIVKVKQLEKTEEGKSKIVSKELEVGKEYSINSPYLRNGNQLSIGPKLKILSTTLGGEYEVQLPDGSVTFLKPSDFKQYNISDNELNTEEYNSLLDKAIFTILGKKKYEGLTVPENTSYIDYVNSLDNKELIDDIEEMFNTLTESFKQKKEAELKELKKLSKDKGQIQVLLNSEDSSIPTYEYKAAESEKDSRKPNNVVPRATIPSKKIKGYENSNLFGSKLPNLPNKDRIKAVLITQKNEETSGAKGLINYVVNDVKDVHASKVIVMAMVEVDPVTKNYSFVDVNGQPTDPSNLDNLIFQVMPLEDLKWSEEFGDQSMFRKGTPKSTQNAVRKEYGKFRKDILNQSSVSQYDITPSFGVPQYDDKGRLTSAKQAKLVSDKELRTSQVLTVPTISSTESLGYVTFTNAIGKVFLKTDSVLVPMQQRLHTEKEAKLIFKAVHRLSELMMEGKLKEEGLPIIEWLKTVVYWGIPITQEKERKQVGRNSVFFESTNLDEKGLFTTLELIVSNKGDKFSFSPTSLLENEDRIVEILQSTYHNIFAPRVNGKDYNSEYIEITDITPEGELKTKRWTNYQTYLLSDEDRAIEDIPLSTPMKPVYGEDSTNRESIYFVINDNEDRYNKILSAAAKKSETLNPIGKKPEQPTKNVNNQIGLVGELKIGGNEPNTFMTPFGPFKFRISKFFYERPGATAKDALIITSPLSEGAENIYPETAEVLRALYTKTLETNPTITKNEVEESLKQQVFDSLNIQYQESSAKEVAEEPKVNKSVNDLLDELNDDDEGISKLREVEELADDYEIEDWAKVEAFMKDNFPKLPITRVGKMLKTVKGRKAFGLYKNRMIYLYQNAEVGTIYHEAFHAVLDMFTSPEEKAAILNEIRNRKPEYKNLTDRQIEEIGAEDTRNYFQYGKAPQKPTSGRPWLVNFLSDLVKIIKEFFLGKQSESKLEDLFKKMGSGFYKDYVAGQNELLSYEKRGVIDIDELAAINDDELFRMALSNQDEHDIVQHMMFETVVYLLDRDLGLANVGTVDKSQLLNTLREVVAKRIVSPVKTAMKIIADTKKEKGEEAAKQKAEKFAPLIEEYKSRAEEILNDDNNWNNITKMYNDKLSSLGITYDEEALYISNDPYKTGKGDYQDSRKVDNFKNSSLSIKLLLSSLPIHIPGTENVDLTKNIRGVQLLPVTQAYMTIMNNIHDSRNINEMMENIRQLAISDTNYLRVYSRLTNGADPKLGYVSYDKINKQHHVQLINSFWRSFKKQNPDVKNLYILDNGDIVIGESNFTTAARQVRDEYFNSIKQIVKDPKNPYFKFKGYDLTTRKRVDAWFGNITDPTSLDKYKKDIPSMIQFLATLNIPFNEDEIMNLSDTNKSIFEKAVSGLINTIAISGAEGKKIVTLDEKIFNIGGRLTELAEVNVIINNPEFSSTYFNVNGERVQTFIGVNLPSNLFNVLSKISNLQELVGTEFEYLLNGHDPFSEGSVLLSKMFDAESGERIQKTEDLMKPSYVDGLVDKNTGKQRDASSVSLRDRLMLELNMNMNGYFSNLVPGDASVEWMVYMGNHFTLTDLLTDQFTKINDIFEKYIISEIKVSRDVNRPVELIKDRSRTDLRFFKTILGKDLHDEIVQFSKDNSELSAEKVYAEFAEKIKLANAKYLQSRANSLRKELIDYELITVNPSNGTEKIEDINLPQTGYISRDMMVNQLIVTEANYIINNIELHKLIYSDPYQYEDELKRIKNFNSPRQALAHGSNQFNTKLNEVYNEGYSKRDVGYTDFTKGSFSTIVYDDVETNDTSISSYIDGWKETDGGGIISFSAYRRLRILADNWNEREELQYRYDVAFYKVINNIKFSNAQEKEIYNNGNPGVRSAYTTIKPIVAGNKDTTGKLNNVLLDKFALMPLSYRIAYEIAADENGIMQEESNAIRLYEKMQTENVDYAVFKSARKVGAGETNVPYGENGELSSEPYKNITEVPISIMSIQSEVPSKSEEKVTEGSQMTKLVTLDSMEAGVPVDFKDSTGSTNFTNSRLREWYSLTDTQKMKKSPLYKKIKTNQVILQESISNGYDYLLKKMGIKETKKGLEVVDFSKVATTLREEILKREVNVNINKALDNFLLGHVVLEATPAYQQIRNILYSIADKNVISRKITGGQKIQIPSTFLEKVRGNKVDGKYTSDVLKFYTNKKGERICEVMVGRWFPNPMGLSDSELLKEINKQLLTGVAFRIPTQKQNSIDRFVIKQFLPYEFGDNVVIPSALVNKSGSDFDIDKLSMYFKNTYFDGEKIQAIPFYGFGKSAKTKFEELYMSTIAKKIEKVQRSEKGKSNLLDTVIEIAKSDSSTSYARKWNSIFLTSFDDMVIDGKPDYNAIKEYLEEKLKSIGVRLDELNDSQLQKVLAEETADSWYTKSLQNAYIESCEDIISDETNFTQLVKPNSAEQLKKLSKSILELRGIKPFDYTNPGNMLNRIFMSRLRNAFVRGKYAIGIAAVNQTNHSLNQRQPIVLDSSRFSSLSNDDKSWMGNDMNINFRKYNKVLIDGIEYPTLSMVHNQAITKDNPSGEYISDILGMFIDGYVDIAKGPWIMELGATPNVASTWMFLVKLGVPIDTIAYFMNQPIIRDYLNTLENSGLTWLFNSDIYKEISKKYPIDKKLMANMKTIPDDATLKAYIPKTSFSKVESTLQRYILKEFLKYAKLAEQSFIITQATNYDTATFNDPFLIFRKEEQFNSAKNTVIAAVNGDGQVVPAVEALLDNSFLGVLSNRIGKVRDAYSNFLKADQPTIRGIVQNVLKEHIRMNERDFLKTAQKIVADLFDWSVQVDKGLNKELKRILLSDTTNTAGVMNSVITKIKNTDKHPLANNYIIKILEMQFSDTNNSNKPNNLKLANKDNKIYDQNQIIYAFQQLKDYLQSEGRGHLYSDIVKAAILQSGTSNSPISFTQLLPYDDFIEFYNSTLANLTSSSNFNVNDFKDLGVFQRNNWFNDDIVPHRKPIWRTDYQTGESYPDNGMEFYDYPKVKEAQGQNKMSTLYRLNTLARGASNDFVVMVWDDYSMSNDEKIQRKKQGDYSFIKRALFKKVYISEGNPLQVISDGRRGVPQYVYKMVNAWGDGYRANEFYDSPTKSLINNGYEKVDVETADSDIISAIFDLETFEESYGLTKDELLEDYSQTTGETVGQVTTPEINKEERELLEQLEIVNGKLESFEFSRDGIFYNLFRSGYRIKPESFDRLVDKNLRSISTNGSYVNSKTGLPYDTLARAAYENVGIEMDDITAVENLNEFLSDYPDSWRTPYDRLIQERKSIEDKLKSPITKKSSKPKVKGENQLSLFTENKPEGLPSIDRTDKTCG